MKTYRMVGSEVYFIARFSHFSHIYIIDCSLARGCKRAGRSCVRCKPGGPPKCTEDGPPKRSEITDMQSALRFLSTCHLLPKIPRKFHLEAHMHPCENSRDSCSGRIVLRQELQRSKTVSKIAGAWPQNKITGIMIIVVTHVVHLLTAYVHGRLRRMLLKQPLESEGVCRAFLQFPKVSHSSSCSRKKWLIVLISSFQLR